LISFSLAVFLMGIGATVWIVSGWVALRKNIAAAVPASR
jgi:hypothetical protein